MRHFTRTAALALGLFGCYRRSPASMRFGEQVPLPRAIASDSVATAKWLAEQKAACPGDLITSEGGLLEFSFDGRPVPYHSHILYVTCERRASW
jgi:hypothetical protein